METLLHDIKGRSSVTGVNDLVSEYLLIFRIYFELIEKLILSRKDIHVFPGSYNVCCLPQDGAGGVPADRGEPPHRPPLRVGRRRLPAPLSGQYSRLVNIQHLSLSFVVIFCSMCSSLSLG